MKKSGIYFISFLLLSFALKAQLISYNLSAVPETVKKNASVVKQFEEYVFTVDDIDKASLSVHTISTVVNEDGKDALDFHVYTSKFISLDDAEIKVYDANGKQTAKYKKKEMITQAMGEGLIDDGYYTFYTVTTSNYPVTIELEYELKYKGTLFYPPYEILLPGEGVVQSSFTAKVPANLGLRYKPRNTDLVPDIKDDGKTKTCKWEVKNLSPFEYEEGAVSYENRYPSILLAPNRFKMDDYEGDMTSWKNFGYWYASMKKGIDVLSDDKKSFFKNMVNQAKDDREKMKIVYEYLQKNFRYVSIQLGIGGYKPFPANFTDSKKYGDCKGLSNFMQAALEAVGIKSYQALINRQANGLPLDTDFPRNGFNHVILFVPDKKDSIWLECTSNSLEFGHLDITTENKNALVVTEAGGVLIPTPKSNSKSNTFSALSIISMLDDGSGNMETTFKSTGEYKELMEDIVKEKKDEQKESFVLGFSFKQPDEFEFTKRETEDIHTTVLKMTVEKIPEFTAGSKIFLAPRLYKFWGRKLPKAENRRLDFYFNFPFERTDTTIYKLPEGYKADVLPPAKELKCEYASYSSKHWYDENQKAVYSTVTLALRQQVIPAAKYAEVKKFFDDVIMNDGQRIVVKKE